ncbi:MAG TPA: DUF4232 domain-containing protein [Luteibacter sp.]|jgi:hypothetical protein|uniref:DUF4232 domain-containing protein n=1 Tax=Luteibacter sp. TaxID=1886636 RepID=UPI002F3E6B71
MPAFTPAVPPCTAEMITLSTDTADGDFDGMSHAGIYLVLTNKSGKACTLPGQPTVALKDARGLALPTARKGPVGMHPGPVVVPVRLEPGASARASLRWVSGDVYDNGRCVDASKVELRFGAQVVTTGFSAHLCGESGKPVEFEQSPLTRGG